MTHKRLLFTVIFACCVLSLNYTNAQIITTVAGRSGLQGYGGDDSIATHILVELNTPRQIAYDTARNLYFADKNNFVLRKISNIDTIYTIAGTHVAGYGGDGGPASAAQFVSPVGVATDKKGNIYVSDFGYGNIRKINYHDTITTIAGSYGAAPTLGYAGDNGPATAALLKTPMYMTVDTNGNLFFADSANNSIREIDVSGNITTVAGSPLGAAGFNGDGGLATAALLHYPTSVVADTFGNLFILDSYNNAVRKVNRSGVISTIAGNPNLWWLGSGYTGDGGPATNAQFNHPLDITLDFAGNVYVADVNNNAIRKIDRFGGISTVVGCRVMGFNGDSLNATVTQLNGPCGMAIMGDRLYFSDSGNNRIRTTKLLKLGVNSVHPFADNDIHISPNPNDGAFIVSGRAGTDQNTVSMSIEDITGKVILNDQVLVENGDFTKKIELDKSVPAGLYFIKVMSDTEYGVIKFLKR